MTGRPESVGDRSPGIEAEIVAAPKAVAARRMGAEQDNGVGIAPSSRAAMRASGRSSADPPEGVGIADEHRIAVDEAERLSRAAAGAEQPPASRDSAKPQPGKRSGRAVTAASICSAR